MVSPRALSPPVLFLVGPTATGKSEMALEIAAQIGGEIINADSRQFYRELNIGTAKPSASDLEKIPHHLVNCASITDPWHLGRFCVHAREVIKDVQLRKKKPLVVGGTGLYVHSLIYGLDHVPSVDPKIRDALSLSLKENGIDSLYHELAKRDPESSKRLNPRDTSRILRALEVVIQTGQPIHTFWKRNKNPEMDFVMFARDLERTLLYRRIDERVLKMWQRGLRDEAQDLWQKYPGNPVLEKTIGYQEWIQNGFSDDARVVATIQKNSRQFAKRQITWFKREEGVQWIKEISDLKRLAQRAVLSKRL